MKYGIETQEKVYEFLRGYIAEHGYAPSVGTSV